MEIIVLIGRRVFYFSLFSMQIIYLSKETAIIL